MNAFDTGSRSVLARCISAEVRAYLGARRIGLRAFASEAGFQSHNYVAVRNRDEKPYDLDDLERICAYLGVEPYTFVERALEHHADDVMFESVKGRGALDELTPAQRDELSERLAADLNDPEVDAARAAFFAEQERKKRSR